MRRLGHLFHYAEDYPRHGCIQIHGILALIAISSSFFRAKGIKLEQLLPKKKII